MLEYRRVVSFPVLSKRQQEVYTIIKLFFTHTHSEGGPLVPLGPYLEIGPDNEPGVYYGEYKNGLKSGAGKMVGLPDD